MEYRLENIKINRFVNGEMTSTERQEFLSGVHGDLFLADAVEGFQNDPSALRDLPKSITHWHFWVGLSVIVGLATAVIFFWIYPIPELSTPYEREEFVMEKIPLRPYVFEKDNGSQSLAVVANAAIPLSKPGNDQPTSLVEISPLMLPTEKLRLRTFDFASQHHSRELARDEKIIFIGKCKVLVTKAVNAPSLSHPSDVMLFGTPAILERNISGLYQSKSLDEQDPTIKAQLEVGLRLFGEGAFNRALQVLEKIELSAPGDVNLVFYGALCHYYLGDFDLAISQLDFVLNGASEAFKPEAKWYLARSMDAVGKHAEASEIFTEIVQSGGHYAEQAKLEL